MFALHRVREFKEGTGRLVWTYASLILHLGFLFIPKVADAAIPSSEHQTFKMSHCFCVFLRTGLRIFSVFSLGLVWCLPGADFSLACLVRFVNLHLPARVAFAYRSNLGKI